MGLSSTEMGDRLSALRVSVMACGSCKKTETPFGQVEKVVTCDKIQLRFHIPFHKNVSILCHMHLAPIWILLFKPNG